MEKKTCWGVMKYNRLDEWPKIKCVTVFESRKKAKAKAKEIMKEENPSWEIHRFVNSSYDRYYWIQEIGLEGETCECSKDFV